MKEAFYLRETEAAADRCSAKKVFWFARKDCHYCFLSVVIRTGRFSREVKILPWGKIYVRTPMDFTGGSCSENSSIFPGRRSIPRTAQKLPGRWTIFRTGKFFPGRWNNIWKGDFPGRCNNIRTDEFFPGSWNYIRTDEYFPGSRNNNRTAYFFTGASAVQNWSNFPGGTYLQNTFFTEHLLVAVFGEIRLKHRFVITNLCSKVNPKNLRFQFHQIEIKDTLKILKDIKASKSAGIDELPPRLIKDGLRKLLHH